MIHMHLRTYTHTHTRAHARKQARSRHSARDRACRSIQRPKAAALLGVVECPHNEGGGVSDVVCLCCHFGEDVPHARLVVVPLQPVHRSLIHAAHQVRVLHEGVVRGVRILKPVPVRAGILRLVPPVPRVPQRVPGRALSGLGVVLQRLLDEGRRVAHRLVPVGHVLQNLQDPGGLSRQHPLEHDLVQTPFQAVGLEGLLDPRQARRAAPGRGARRHVHPRLLLLHLLRLRGLRKGHRGGKVGHHHLRHHHLRRRHWHELGPHHLRHHRVWLLRGIPGLQRLHRREDGEGVLQHCWRRRVVAVHRALGESLPCHAEDETGDVPDLFLVHLHFELLQDVHGHRGAHLLGQLLEHLHRPLVELLGPLAQCLLKLGGVLLAHLALVLVHLVTSLGAAEPRPRHGHRKARHIPDVTRLLLGLQLLEQLDTRRRAKLALHFLQHDLCLVVEIRVDQLQLALELEGAVGLCRLLLLGHLLGLGVHFREALRDDAVDERRLVSDVAGFGEGL
mmetsp:Transcript_36839/g.114667  ORF Transcript_36839/g.114667 Transcript_36839/m.114667 type:complete len:505 (-) Transcript_36839:800-2314(-)